MSNSIALNVAKERDTRTHELLALASFNGRPFVASHNGALVAILSEIIEDGNRLGEFVVVDPPRLARVIQTATVKFCDPRPVEQYHDEPLEDQARELMHALISGLPTIR